jgi:hypothetical protein
MLTCKNIHNDAFTGGRGRAEHKLSVHGRLRGQRLLQRGDLPTTSCSQGFLIYFHTTVIISPYELLNFNNKKLKLERYIIFVHIWIGWFIIKRKRPTNGQLFNVVVLGAVS